MTIKKTSNGFLFHLFLKNKFFIFHDSIFLTIFANGKNSTDELLSKKETP